MGQGQATEASQEPLWVHPDAENGTTYSEDTTNALKERILALSKNHETFLKRHSDYFQDENDFVYHEDYLERSQAAISHDTRLAAWFSKLVPKNVSETEFWRNYFSHISYLHDEALAGRLASEGSAPAAAGDVQQPNASEDSNSQNANSSSQSQSEDVSSSTQEVGGGGDKPRAPPPETRPPDLQKDNSTPQNSKSEQKEPIKEQSHDDVKVDAEKRKSIEYLFEEYIEDDIDESSGEFGDPIRWGIIGCGDVCEWKSGPAFQNARGSRLVAVMSRSSARAKRFAERHNVPKWYSDALSLVRDPDVEAVYIATPPSSHLELARMVGREGKPCFVEKPMARSYEECKQMVKVFFDNSLPLFVAYYRRAQARFIRAKDIVENHIGEVTSIHCRYMSRNHIDKTKSEIGWRVECEESGGGLFMDMAAHTLDILDFIFGPLSHVYGDAVLAGSVENIDVETVVGVTFRTQKNVVGSCLWNFVSSINEDELDITGTEGRMTMSIFGTEPPTLHLPGQNGVVSRQVTAPFPKYVHQPLVQTICDELRGVGERKCPAPGYAARRTARVMDIVLRKYYKDRTDEFWSRPNTWDTAQNEK